MLQRRNLLIFIAFRVCDRDHRTAPACPVAGTNYFPFDPTTGPGYMLHCHIPDHENNEMMRPYIPKK